MQCDVPMSSRSRVPRALISLLLLIPLATACKTLDPYTGEQQISKTAKGAGIGALAGAAVGALAGGKRGALIGAAAGGLTGGALGNYMDRQEATLREELARTGVSVTRVGDQIHLNMPGDITFETSQSDVKPDFYDVLSSVAIVLKEFEQTIVEVEGHTDSSGSDAYNLELSQKRAQSVASYLQAQGVHPNRLRTTGMGESRPLRGNDTPGGRQMNRRVELHLIPIQA